MREAFGRFLGGYNMLESKDFVQSINPVLEAQGFVPLEVKQPDEAVSRSHNDRVDDFDLVDLEEVSNATDYKLCNTFTKIVDENNLLIVHPPIYSSKGDDVKIITSNVRKRVSSGILNNVFHLVPEVVPGRAASLLGVGSDHICLRLMHFQNNELVQDYLIDPREIAQNCYDLVNCGRYVLTMTVAFLKLIEKQPWQVIDKAILCNNPIVMNAYLLSSQTSRIDALNCLYQNVVSSQTSEKNFLVQREFIYKYRVNQGLDYYARSGPIPGFMFYGASAQEKLAEVQTRLHALERAQLTAESSAVANLR